MAKIPVGRTIAYAYSFTFRNFLSILGLSWLPLVVVGVAAYFTLPAYVGAMQAMALNQDVSQLPAAMGMMVLFGLVAFACFTMIYVGVTRQALELHKGMAFVYFSLDRAFWSLIMAYLLLVLIYIGFAIGFGIVMGIVGAAATLAAGPIVGGALVVLVSFFLIFFIVYAALRATFLLAPVAVAEGHHVVRRSWALTKGNFWRSLGTILGVLIPFIIAEIVIGGVVMANVSVPAPEAGAGPEQVAAYTQAIFGAVGGMLPILIPVGLILYAMAIGLVTGASAFAYRALAGESPEKAAAPFA